MVEALRLLLPEYGPQIGDATMVLTAVNDGGVVCLCFCLFPCASVWVCWLALSPLTGLNRVNVEHSVR